MNYSLSIIQKYGISLHITYFQMIDLPITVLMPVYNAEPFLKEAIESILSQTFKDFEFLIINDGSTDGSKAIIQSYQDSRIRFVENETNSKLIVTLNRGIKLAKGKYIVRMDADDISLPERLQLLYDFMESHPEVGLCGSWFENFFKKGTGPIVKYATDDQTIRFKQLHQIHLSHGTCIFRTEVLKSNKLLFNPDFIHAEDYELWTRIARFTKFANIAYILYRVRNNEESVSNKYSSIQKENTKRIIINQFRQLKIDFNEEDFELYCKFGNAEFPWFDISKVQKLESLLTEMISRQNSNSYLSTIELQHYWSEKLFHLCYNVTGSMNIWKSSVFYDKKKLTVDKKIKMLLRGFISILK
jgi:glycosyltransferase involved in cell wall biosynthesis